MFHILIGRTIRSLSIGYTVWTLFVHFLTTTRASFLEWCSLALLSACLSMLGYFALEWRFNWNSDHPLYEDFPDLLYKQKSSNHSLWLRITLILTVLSFLSSIILFKWVSITLYLFNIFIIVVFGILYLRHPKIQAQPRFNSTSMEPLSFRSQLGPLSILLIILLGGFLFLHQVDADDSNIFSLAVGAKQTNYGTMAFDSMIGDTKNAPLHLPTYRVQSFELLSAALSVVFGGETIFYGHIIVPCLFLLWFWLAIVYIYHSLFREHWWVYTFIHISIIALFCFGPFSIGAHGIFRFQQGKAPYVSIIVPLVIFYVSRWQLLGKTHDLFFLFIHQIVAVGITANAIVSAPLAAGIGAFAAWIGSNFRPNIFSRSVWAVSACIYPILAGLYFILIEPAHPSEIPAYSLSLAWTYFLGFDGLGVILAALFPVLFLLSEQRGITRAQWAYLTATAFVLLNPLWAHLLIAATGNISERIFWSVAFPCIFAIPIASRLTTLKMYQKLLFISSFLIVSHIVMLKRAQLAPFYPSLPALRIPKDQAIYARRLVELTPKGCTVLAPEKYAQWIPVFDDHPYVVATRYLVLKQYEYTMNSNERRLRWALFDLVSNSEEEPLLSQPHLDINSIKPFKIGLIATTIDNKRFSEVRQLAQELGFPEGERIGDLWYATKPCEHLTQPANQVF